MFARQSVAPARNLLGEAYPPRSDALSEPRVGSKERRAVVAASFGTLLEWYDFFVYGTAAALVFPAVFFPQADPATGVLLSFAAFATGFIARPVGGLVAGWTGDRFGRRPTLIATVLVMGIATVTIGLLPTYAQVGMLAPMLLVLLRLAQGAATGGEWGGAALLAVEQGGGRSGGRGAFVQSALYLGLLLGNLAFVIVGAAMAPEALLAWGWRIPFLASAVLLIIAVVLRGRVAETPHFEAARTAQRLTRRPLIEVLRHPRGAIAIFLMRTGQNTAFYVVSVFCLAYATGTLGLERWITLTALLVGAGIAAVMCPVWGRLGDRVGAFPLVAFGLVGLALLAFPLFFVLESGNAVLVIGVVAVMIGVINSAADSMQPAWYATLFAPRVRYSGITLGREAGAIVGGGMAPLAAVALVTGTGHWWPVAALIAFGAATGLAGALLARAIPEADAESST